MCVFSLQVLKEEEDRICVHYNNYSSTFDTWIQRDAVIKKVPHHPLPFTADYIKDQLKLEVKERLLCRTKQSNEVIVKIDCTPEIFSELFHCQSNASLHPANIDPLIVIHSLQTLFIIVFETQHSNTI